MLSNVHGCMLIYNCTALPSTHLINMNSMFNEMHAAVTDITSYRFIEYVCLTQIRFVSQVQKRYVSVMLSYSKLKNNGTICLITRCCKQVSVAV